MSERVGPYELLRRLGRGGMGEVWLARLVTRDGLTKHVALKLSDSDPGADGPSLREARVSLLFTHSNIVSVFDAGVDDDRGWVAMEWIDGVDLAHLVAVHRAHGARGLGERIAVFVTTQVLRALAYAHGLQHDGKPLRIVHRDISPSNVLVSRGGEVKLTDFGIARSRLSSTTDDKVKGKVRYMAPEQFAGEPVDARADLFAVGAMLHELLCGHPLRSGSGAAEIVAEIAASQVPALDVPVSEPIERVRQWLLAPDPQQRPASAWDVLAFLRASGLDADATQDLSELCRAVIGEQRPTVTPDAGTAPENAARATRPMGDATWPAGQHEATTHTHAESVAKPTRAKRGVRLRWILVGTSAVALAVTGVGVVATRERDIENVATAPASEPQPDPKPASTPKARPTLKDEPVAEASPRAQAPSVDTPSDRPLTIAAPCVVDPDGDGIYDVLATTLAGLPSDPTVAFVLIDGSTGEVRERRVHPATRRRAECIPGGYWRETDAGEIELWSATDLSSPRQTVAPPDRPVVAIGDGCVRVGDSGSVSFAATTLSPIAACKAESPSHHPGLQPHRLDPFVVTRDHASVSTRRLDGGNQRLSYSERAAPGSKARGSWTRNIKLPQWQPSIAISDEHVWTTSRTVRGTDVLLALRRSDGATAFEITDGVFAFPQFLVEDAKQVLQGGGHGVCSFEPDDGAVRWCHGLRR